MHFSISSLFITSFVSSVLISLFSFILKHEKSYYLFRADLLFVLGIITCLRLFFPFEFSFTKTIALPTIMNPLITFLNFNLFHEIRIIHILILVWLIGILIGSGIYIQNILSVKRIEERILQNAKKAKLSETLEHCFYPDYDIYITSAVPSPMVLGFKKCILLPNIEFSKSELTNILNHEAQHLQQNDILFKQVISILTILYWWFPPIYWLRKNINFYIEIRADEKVTESFDSISTLEYAETLIKVQKKIQISTSIISSELSSYLIGESQNILSYRVNYLLNKQINKKTNKIILCILFLLPIVTNSLIFEPFFDNSKELIGTYSKEELLSESYLIQHKNGSYSFYNDKKIIPISDPDEFIKMGIKVVKE